MLSELKFIGRGSAFTPGEVNNSAYIIYNGTFILFDCGSDVFKKIIDKKLLENVRRVLILLTHIHEDHTGSLVSLLEYCRYGDRCPQVESIYIFDTVKSIYSAVPAAPYKDRFDTFLGVYGASVEWYKKVEVVDQYFVSNILGIEVTPIRVDHCEVSYAYGIRLGADSSEYIYYSGDCKDHRPALRYLDDLPASSKVALYIDVSSKSNHYHVYSHFPEKLLPDFIKEVRDVALIRGIKYSINIMHIDEFGSYKELAQKLIVNTI